ncbi:MAG: hypothetical protein ACK5XN_25610 [Bacteroidota bacterium]|jgi:hypothetical protein
MSYRTADQIRQEMITAMGEEAGKLFHVLENELLWLSLRWKDYKELFGTNPDRIELMNETAPSLFYSIQKVYWEHLLLGYSRLLEQAESRVKKEKKTNATYPALLQILQTSEFNDARKKCEKQGVFCRDWRNRKIAHMDYEIYVNGGAAKPLDTASRSEFAQALQSLQELHNSIALHYGLGRNVFNLRINSHGERLLRILENGLRFQDEESKRMVKEIPANFDFKSRV